MLFIMRSSGQGGSFFFLVFFRSLLFKIWLNPGGSTNLTDITSSRSSSTDICLLYRIGKNKRTVKYFIFQFSPPISASLCGIGLGVMLQVCGGIFKLLTLYFSQQLLQNCLECLKKNIRLV